MRAECSLTKTPPKAKKHHAASRYVIKVLHRDEVVIDRTTGLMWQQSSSSQAMAYHMAMSWIRNLNKCGFAGFTNWRLPTLEEALTLLEESPSSTGLYIDPVFRAKQRLWMWTSERESADAVWYVNFNYGYSQVNRIKSSHNYVCAVRSRV